VISGQGTAVLDFGATPGSNEAQVNVTGQTEITALCTAEAWVMADDSTGSHTANDHRYFNTLAGLTCSTPAAGVGFTIYANSIHKLTGTFQVRFVWAG